MYKKIRQNPLSRDVHKTHNRHMRVSDIRIDDERVQYMKNMKELISILLESSLYLTIPLKERHALIRMILDEHQFLSHREAKKC
jgi:hypothetical protein